MMGNRTSQFGRAACALALSAAMATGPLLDGAASVQFAYAAERESLDSKISGGGGR